ncbi:hypothetical protein J6590_094345 [Homalodisca vitripennis]|nr:hypothetical protein J6590_097056 [Homalodisca vitripennis]KAG8250780.1 hypothetical protein J6590_094345 [Homalodisca vitripennis]
MLQEKEVHGLKVHHHTLIDKLGNYEIRVLPVKWLNSNFGNTVHFVGVTQLGGEGTELWGSPGLHT